MNEANVKIIGKATPTSRQSRQLILDINYCCPTLTASQGGGVVPKIVEPKIKQLGQTGKKLQHSRNIIIDTDYCSPTLNCALGGGQTPCITENEPYKIRKLTPRECWRLMGVKNEDFDKVKDEFSDSLLYHMAGDSIVVDVLYQLFKEML